MSDVTAVDLFDALFYSLTKEQMEALCPSDLRVIIRKAFDNERSGMGPGPTMQQVIDHYYDQRNYWVFRCMNPTSGEMLDALDLLFKISTGQAGSQPWKVPSIYEGSDQFHGIGDFDFKDARAQYPEADALLTKNGWAA